MNRPRDIEAWITYLPTKDGGRSKPAFSEYWPHFCYAGGDWDAVHTYPDVEKVEPGETPKGTQEGQQVLS